MDGTKNKDALRKTERQTVSMKLVKSSGFAFCPNVHGERHGNDAVADKDTEIFPNHRIIHQCLTRERGHNEEHMEQEDAEDRLPDRRFINRSAADKERRDREEPDVEMCPQ